MGLFRGSKDEEIEQRVIHFGHRRFLFYESFKLYVLPAHPLQRSRLLQTILWSVGSRRKALHKSRHLFPLQHIQVGPKGEATRFRKAGTLLGLGAARHRPHVLKRQEQKSEKEQKSQKEEGRKQQAEEDLRQAKLPGNRPAFQQAPIAAASHDSREPQQQQDVSAAAATPAASPHSIKPPPSQKHPTCSPRASANWRAQLWAGLTQSHHLSASQTPQTPRPCRSKLSSSSPFQLAHPSALSLGHPPSASQPQSPSAHPSAPAPSTPQRSLHFSASITLSPPLSPAAQDVILTADTLLARAKQLNSRFPPAPIHQGAAHHAPPPTHSLTQSSTTRTLPHQLQQHQHQNEHQHHQHLAQSRTSQAARQLAPSPHHTHQTHRLSDAPTVNNTSTLARKEEQIAALVLGAVDPLLKNATALARYLEEQAAARVKCHSPGQRSEAQAAALGAAATMKAPALSPPPHEYHQPACQHLATPGAAVKGLAPASSKEQSTPVYEAGSNAQSTPVYEAGRGGSVAHHGLWDSRVRAQSGREGEETATPRDSPGMKMQEMEAGSRLSYEGLHTGRAGREHVRSVVRPLPEQEEPAAARNDLSLRAGSSHGRGSKSAGADGVLSWRQQVGWDLQVPLVGPKSTGGARRRLDFEGVHYLRNVPAVRVGAADAVAGAAVAAGAAAAGGSTAAGPFAAGAAGAADAGGASAANAYAGGGPGLQALTSTEKGNSTCSHQPSGLPHPQDSAINTATRSLRAEVGGQGRASAAVPETQSQAHLTDKAEAQVLGVAKALSRPWQSGIRASQPAHAGSASLVTAREMQQQQQWRDQGRAKSHDPLGMDPRKANVPRGHSRSSNVMKTQEQREAGVAPNSRHTSRKGVRPRFMRSTITAAVKRQVAHPAARPSWKGQQAALVRRRAGLSPCAPIAAGRHPQSVPLMAC